ncbi:MAG TPA: DNA polymerase III subunit gamma/tau, partial [Thermoanaerobaculia bacterium]|nr:DNA polymerase III subunit gamma/tau [Thermoanaerobaculia bacterium]
MAHLSLPRKWRPRTFADLIGQDSVARTLMNAISEVRIAPAYLLTGPRGVGKTSTARLLARCLNCEKGPTVDPCGECASCREILARGESLDVHEMDGASNRKIENARELIETIRYVPQRDRYRIAIIDEVHMLTSEAFNALLKTLEEPPPHSRFILASTELHKIPATIVSRCQRFTFRALSVAEIVRHLDRVAREEKIRATPEALETLAAAAEGSVRDALSLLDQAATLSGNNIDQAVCAEILALVDRELLESVYSAIATGDRGAAIASLSKLLEGGEDPRHVLKEFIGLLRRLLLLSAGANPDVAEGDRDRMLALARAMPYDNLLRALALAVDADQLDRRTEDPGLVLQMLVLRLAELPRLSSIEEALSGLPAEGARPPAAPEPSTVRDGGSRSREEGPRILSLVPVDAEPNELTSPPSQTPGSDERALQRFRQLLSARRRVTAAKVSLAESTTVEGDELVLRFGIDKAPAKEALDEPPTRKILSETASEAFGRPMRVRLQTGPPADGDLGKAAQEVP